MALLLKNPIGGDISRRGGAGEAVPSSGVRGAGPAGRAACRLGGGGPGELHPGNGLRGAGTSVDCRARAGSTVVCRAGTSRPSEEPSGAERKRGTATSGGVLAPLLEQTAESGDASAVALHSGGLPYEVGRLP